VIVVGEELRTYRLVPALHLPGGSGRPHLPERLSRRNRNRVLKLSSRYRNPMVKHEPELPSGSGTSRGHGRTRDRTMKAAPWWKGHC
jgi:hypothetical protein